MTNLSKSNEMEIPVEKMTYGQLKEAGKGLGLNVTGKALPVLREMVAKAMGENVKTTNGDEVVSNSVAERAIDAGQVVDPIAPAEEPKQRAKTKPTPAPVQTAPAINSAATAAPETPTPAALAAKLIEEKKVEMQQLQDALKKQLDDLKAEGTKIKEAAKLVEKETKAAARATELEAKKLEREAARAEAKKAKDAEKEAKRLAKEKELAVVYKVGERVVVNNKGKDMTARVIATDIYDSRSGYSFYRFRRILLDPTDNSEVAGSYFFKRNYTIPQSLTAESAPATSVQIEG